MNTNIKALSSGFWPTVYTASHNRRENSMQRRTTKRFLSCRNRRRRRRRGGAASTPNDRDENTSSPQISRWEVDVRECPAQTSASSQRVCLLLRRFSSTK